MGIESVSEGSSNADFNAEEEPAVRHSQSPTAGPWVGSANVFPENLTAASRAASLVSLAESFGSSQERRTVASVGTLDLLKTSSSDAGMPVSNALRGPAIKEPQEVDVGSALLPNLRENPTIDHEDIPGPSEREPKGPIAQAGNVLAQGAKLARRASAPVGRFANKLTPPKPKQMNISPTKADAMKRRQEVFKRDRYLDELQDNPADREARRAVRRGVRE